MQILSDTDLHDRYDEFLDETHGDTVMIAGLEYTTSRALHEVDPIAYRVGFSEWLDFELQDGSLFELPDEDYTDEPWFMVRVMQDGERLEADQFFGSETEALDIVAWTEDWGTGATVQLSDHQGTILAEETAA